MQNSPGLPLVALLVGFTLAATTVVSVMAGIGGFPALSELQIGATAWALALGIYGVQGIISIVVEGRQIVPGSVPPRISKPLSLGIGGLSIVLLVVAAMTGSAIVLGQSTAMIGSAAGAGCLVLALLLLFYKERFIGHEAHLEPRQDGIPW
jgi:hypothetical protein